MLGNSVQIRRLSTRIAVAFALLLLIVEIASLVLINSVLSVGVDRDVQKELNAGERFFNLMREERSRRLTQDASVLAQDFGFRKAAATNDRATLDSVLENHGKRINADVMMLVGLDENVMADTLHQERTGNRFAFTHLLRVAEQEGQATAFAVIDGNAYELVLVPVKAPLPIAWLATGVLINDRFAADLNSLSALEVSFLTPTRDGHCQVLASSLRADDRSNLPSAFNANCGQGEANTVVTLADGDYVTRLFSLGSHDEGVVRVALQKSLRLALATLNKLQLTMLGMGAVSLLATIVAGVLMARNMTRPLNVLSGFAQRVEQGDYSVPLKIEREDEIGQLASAFNHMRTGIAAREARITDLASQDPLTGLPNRALLRDRLEQAIKASRRSGETPTLLVMDLDRFHEVNKALGHNIGDLLLQQVSQRLLTVVMRESDTVARLGGDEFAILLPAADAEGGIIIARKLLDALEQTILLNGHELIVGASIGIAVFPEHGDEVNSLMRRADTAMYAAKRSNSGFAVYDPRFEGRSEEQLSLMAELRHAIENDELVLHYQPKVELATGTVHHAEALLRWRHPKRGFVPPDTFIPFAERTGFIKSLTRWVLGSAVRQGRAWRDAGLDIQIAINVSARDLVTPELPRMFGELVKDESRSLDWLSLEITESTIMADPGHALSTLEYLSKLGLRLSIDDFGTGYSSLAYLKKLPVDELKIDKSFVLDMQKDRDDATIVQSTIALGHNMGLKVVAEGIEDAETLELLRQLGCDYGQGYYFSKALAAGDFENWLRESPWSGGKRIEAGRPPVRLVK
jgi:diguanylate cyclase (GGDEF)-like protein